MLRKERIKMILIILGGCSEKITGDTKGDRNDYESYIKMTTTKQEVIFYITAEMSTPCCSKLGKWARNNHRT